MWCFDKLLVRKLLIQLYGKKTWRNLKQCAILGAYFAGLWYSRVAQYLLSITTCFLNSFAWEASHLTLETFNVKLRKPLRLAARIAFRCPNLSLQIRLSLFSDVPQRGISSQEVSLSLFQLQHTIVSCSSKECFIANVSPSHSCSLCHSLGLYQPSW